MSRGGIGGVLGSSIALLACRGCAPTRSEGSRSSLGSGSGLAMSLKSHGMRESPMGLN